MCCCCYYHGFVGTIHDALLIGTLYTEVRIDILPQSYLHTVGQISVSDHAFNRFVGNRLVENQSDHR